MAIDASELDAVRSMWGDGATVLDVAKSLGKSESWVRNRLERLGIRTSNANPRCGQGQCVGCSQPFAKNAVSHKLCHECIPDYKSRNLWVVYHLTKPRYLALFESQRGLCRLCTVPITSVFDEGYTKSKRKAFVDHDHKTRKVRGLLCARCNTTLGTIEAYSAPGWLERLDEYLHGSH